MGLSSLSPGAIILTACGFLAIVGSALGLGVTTWGWRPDFANTAWGAAVGMIVGALLTGVVGVWLKGSLDRQLAERQSQLTQQANEALESKRAVLSQGLKEVEGRINEAVQKAVEREKGAITRDVERYKHELTRQVEVARRTAIRLLAGGVPLTQQGCRQGARPAALHD